MQTEKPYKIVYCTPSLYLKGGVERVLTLKANYFAEQFGWDITIILTDGKGKPFAYPLSDKVKVVHLDVNFEALWTCSFAKKVVVYLRKQRQYKRKLKAELMRIRPDITVSLLRREINFITRIPDGSKKVGELHVNRSNYRNFEANDTNWAKALFAKFWMRSLVSHLKRLDKFVVLTEEDKRAWKELDNVTVVYNPLPFATARQSTLAAKRVVAVGRYTYQKGFDLLLRAWSRVEKECPEWQLAIYGSGDRGPYERLARELNLDAARCHLNASTSDIQQEYADSSLFVFSSRFEGFGMALVEAMACGLPVVSFDCPCGPKDIVSNGEDGLLVESTDVESLADAIVSLANNPRRRAEMAAKAVESAKRFDISIIAAQWKQLYDGLMK